MKKFASIIVAIGVCLSMTACSPNVLYLIEPVDNFEIIAELCR